jgi:hypothetical protein
MSAGAGWLPYSSLDTPDDVYSIDLASGAKTLISSEGTYNMSDLIITKTAVPCILLTILLAAFINWL